MKIGFVSMPLSGHLNPMTSLGRTLQSRGHEVVFIGLLDSGPAIRAAGLEFAPYCDNEYPSGSIAEIVGSIAKLQGMDALQHTSRDFSPGLAKAAYDHLPEKLAETGIDALVIDAMHFLQFVPISLGIPFVQVWTTLPIDPFGTTPLCYFSWPHDTTPDALARNVEGLKLIGELVSPTLAVIMEYAKKVGLQIDWHDPGSTSSKLAVISQVPKDFDFPGTPWPPQFHYAGPFHSSEGRENVSFPWESLSGGPLIYASLGTMINNQNHVYRVILEAVRRFPAVQLVLSVGNNVDFFDLEPIPTNAIVVRRAPQIEILKRATLCITHAGLNTTLESLANGVPMVAIPITYDQPGVAARIAYRGVGEFVELQDLSVEHLAYLINKVLVSPGYRERARYFQDLIAESRGLDVAADVIERALETSQGEVGLRSS